jgi:hypothetical protein
MVLFFIYQMLRNSATCSFIVELRKAVSLSQIFCPKWGFSRNFWKKRSSKAAMGDFCDTAALPSSHIKVSNGVSEP